VPSLLWHGENGDFNFLVTELLGASLEDYFQICKKKFSLKTTLMIAEKVLSSIEFLHYKNFIHRDIKPDNFLMGLGRKLHQIHTVDYGYSTSYFNPVERTHRPNKID
jgi:serine/threonine protein kinase